MFPAPHDELAEAEKPPSQRHHLISNPVVLSVAHVPVLSAKFVIVIFCHVSAELIVYSFTRYLFAEPFLKATLYVPVILERTKKERTNYTSF